MRRLRRVFDGTARRTAVGACLVLLAGLFAFVVLSSQGGWQWFGGKAVVAHEDTGTVMYSYKGQNFSIDDAGSSRTGPSTVWLDPHDPSQATLNGLTVARISDSLFVGLPALIGAGLVASGFAWKYRRRRRQPGPAGRTTYGAGIDPDTIAGIVSRRRSHD